MTVKEVIKQRMAQYGTTLKFIIQNTGIKADNIYGSLGRNRTRPLKSEEFVAICLLLGLTMEDFKAVVEGGENNAKVC